MRDRNPGQSGRLNEADYVMLDDTPSIPRPMRLPVSSFPICTDNSSGFHLAMVRSQTAATKSFRATGIVHRANFCARPPTVP